jgi:NADPH:quinone reductase-like Zn-dependent oxidoreductase
MGVADVSIGDSVFGWGKNTLAQYAILTHWTHKPDDMSFEVAGSFSVVIETALRSLGDLSVHSGETLLVSGAAGGIGTAVVQIARQRGIIVIGTASLSNHDYLRELGAIATTYGPGLKQRVEILAPIGVDAALDIAGSGVIADLIEIVGMPSRVVSVADFSACQYGALFSKGPPDNPDQVLAEVKRLYNVKQFRFYIEKVFPLESTAEAHKISEQGHVRGKLVIAV